MALYFSLLKEWIISMSASIEMLLMVNEENVMKNKREGFTLVEIMIVIVIIGLLATMALPAFKKVRERSQNVTFAKSLTAFRDAMDVFMLDTGELPGDGGSGNLHASMQEYIKSSDFEVDKTVIGGVWDIELNKSGVISAVGVHNPSVSNDQLAQIDSLLDDGDIASGNMRIIASGRFYWVLLE